jgi:uncharacterized membrane protein
MVGWRPCFRIGPEANLSGKRGEWLRVAAVFAAGNRRGRREAAPRNEPHYEVRVMAATESVRVDRALHAYEAHVVRHLDVEYEKNTRKADRVADRVSAFAGSWRFISIFGIFLVAWVLWNLVTPRALHFDPAPFILLNLLLSFIAGFQAPFIMMSQNRAAERAKVEADIDYALNYKAELDVEEIKRHLHHLERQMTELRALLQHPGPAD